METWIVSGVTILAFIGGVIGLFARFKAITDNLVARKEWEDFLNKEFHPIKEDHYDTKGEVIGLREWSTTNFGRKAENQGKYGDELRELKNDIEKLKNKLTNGGDRNSIIERLLLCEERILVLQGGSNGNKNSQKKQA